MIRHVLPTLFATALCLFFAGVPAFGDVHFHSETRVEQSQGQAPGPMKVEGWVKGSKGKFLFTESSGNPMVPQGSYLLTLDGGRTFTLVNPQEKTWAEWDIEGMLRFAGSVMNSMGPLLKMKVEEPKVEMLSEGDGESILGLPTRHYRMRTTYGMEVRVLGIKQANTTETIQELWTTTAIDDEAFAAWLRKEPPKTGNEELDKLVTAEVGKTEGFVLKSTSESVSTPKKKKKRNRQTTSRSITEVTFLDQNVSIDDATFTFPRDEYQRTEMAVPTSEEGEGNPLKGLFGKS